MQTLNGGVELSGVLGGSGEDEKVFVRQLPVKEYDRAFSLIDDEIGFVALACGKPKSWAESLSPESYEDVNEAVRKVNACFFAFAERRQSALLKLVQQAGPELIKLAAEKASSASLPGLRPHAA